VLIFSAQESYATHNRAGEITYVHLGGFEYRITITTYTKESAIADRPYLKIRWGDEPSDVTEAELDSLIRNGEFVDLANDLKRNIYEGTHIYSGAGTFNIVVEDPNRNSGVVNINNGTPGTDEGDKTSTSVMAIFCIQTTLIIRPGNDGHNNSVQLLKLPIQNACIFQPWVHNPVASDPDGDELLFSLVSCLGAGAQPLMGWESPEDYTESPNDTFTIDPQTGDISWLTPLVAGEYNIAILIQEFRNGSLVGSVLRDMQITVRNCANIPPIIVDLLDICIEAGTTVEVPINYSDPNGNIVTVFAYGGPLTQVLNTATWNAQTNIFKWAPECEEVRAQPYLVSFEAQDNGNVSLSDIETVMITVVAPAVQNPQANAANNQIVLTWNVSPCASIFSPQDAAQVKYKIYRRNGFFGFIPALCELGVPGDIGYSFVGEVSGVNTNTYTDNDVNYGGEYCYMVVTCWPDGAESYASAEFCALVVKDVPVMTKVSVGVTDISSGVDTVHWSKPTALDPLIFPGPYRYKLFHSTGFDSPQNMIFTSDEFEILADGDTTFVHENIPTIGNANNYHVTIYSESLEQDLSSSNEASSVFLSLQPDDNTMMLTISHQVPWINYEYHIYRKALEETEFTFIDTAFVSNYLDTNLINNQLYCYKVLAFGSYYANDVPDPLVNWSQEACSTPFDKTPPCAPVVSATPDCENIFVSLLWDNPNNSCANDVTAYNIYYAPVQGMPLELIATINQPDDTTYLFTPVNTPLSIAGCYSVTALDSLNLWPDGLLYQNESVFSNIVCVDNCPVYELPNIFTPNLDGKNDLFVPFEYRFVQSIVLKIFNRWGNLVFETADPNINWDGKNKDSGNPSVDGTYFYTIRVNTIRLVGIVPEDYSGTIRISDSITKGVLNN